jgi:hypothetical protein
MIFGVGEKRKQRLQYLQQLVGDRSNDDKTPQASLQQHEALVHSLSAEYHARPNSSPYLLLSRCGNAHMQEELKD